MPLYAGGTTPVGPVATKNPQPLPPPGAAPTIEVYHAPGTIPANDTPGPYGILPFDNGYATPAVAGYSPQQIRAAYGVDGIKFGDVVGDGLGMTVAIVDAYDNPYLVNSTAPNFATSDLAQYDAYFGLPDPPSFTKVGQAGGAPPTATDPTGGWEAEEALDVEMVHAIAPMAKIILVEANSPADLYTADTYAATQAPVVSNSWGGPEFSGELASDSTFTASGVTFLFATGDSGAPGGYPAYSPNVVAVGGTSLYTNATNNVTYETGWSTTGLLGSLGGGGGGGTSQYETPEPSYQQAVQNTGARTIPDVSSNADPATGVAIFDTYNGGWFEVGGTSEACPTWAGYITIADQGRALLGAPPLTGYNQTLPALYNLPYTDFNDVTVGNNQTTSFFDQAVFGGPDNPGFRAKAGYDEVTGLGTPKANLLVPDLAAFGLSSLPSGQIAVTTQPPSSVISGNIFGLTVTIEDQFGNVDSNFNGPATLSLTANPGGATFSPVTVTAVNGVAVFQDLSLVPTHAGYQFQVAVSGLTTVSTDDVSVIANSTPQAGTFYPTTNDPVQGDASLRNAILSADNNSLASNTIYLESGVYTLTNAAAGQLLIDNATTSGVASKTLTIIGAGAGQTIIEPSLASGFSSRVFEIVSKSGSAVRVVFQDLTIAGGYAVNGGVLGGNAALGGGVLIDGGMVSMTNVDLVGNVAGGAAGALGAAGGKGGGGGQGGAGGVARGGGFYLASGTLNLKNTDVSQNMAWGGRGGSGGLGGLGSARGGSGGRGGTASGGGGYVVGGVVAGTNNDFRSDAVVGGRGGSGGMGGTGTNKFGGAGGRGADGGKATGAGLFVGGGTLSIKSSFFFGGAAQGGDGGWGNFGGLTKAITLLEKTIFVNGSGGSAGNGGNALGAGLYLQAGQLSLTGGGATGEFGNGGSGGLSGNTFVNGATKITGPGANGSPIGGGIFVGGGELTIAGFSVTGNQAGIGGGIYNATGGSIAATGINVAGNVATGLGGGLYNQGVLALGGVVAANSAASGGGIYNVGKLSFTGASVINNTALKGDGGGIYNLGGVVKASNLDVSSNKAVTRGGGIYSYQGALSISGISHIEYNTVSATSVGSTISAAYGGGIGLNGGSAGIKATIVGATIANNSAEYGGGIFVSNGKVTIDNGSISNNSATDGGGINNLGTVTLSSVIVSNNSASAVGGGIQNARSLTISGGQVSGNTAGTNGGGINNSSAATIAGRRSRPIRPASRAVASTTREPSR